MDNRFRKFSNMSSFETTLPILTRRRLSAPETIMRKHSLAQQRSSSEESGSRSDSTQSCNWPLNNSESNLIKKKDIDIRKSTLMKRFWDNSKTIQFPRTYAEWQYSFGKVKLGSNYSTPEHMRSSRRSVFELSPTHKRHSPDLQVSPKRKYSNIYDSQNNNGYKEMTPKYSRNRHISNEDLEEYDESYTVYSSNFSNATSTQSPKSSSRPTDATMSIVLSESSDTYSQNLTTPIPASSKSSDSKNNNIQSYHIHTNVVSNNSDNEESSNQPIQYQFILRENIQPDSSSYYEFIPTKDKDDKKLVHESATQTVDTTNLNVITNVQLSQSTLNLIFKQVMQDVILNKDTNTESSQPTIINVKKLPSFTLPNNETIKPRNQNAISEVNVGSPYKSKAAPVPRLSALPKTSSMEVNISSNESFEKDSDSGSLIDSLDDPQSPRRKEHTRNIEDTLSLLPENSNSNKSVLPKKPSVFYIPIENNDKAIKNINDNKDVSSLLPTKLKERLIKRQLKREQKIKENNLGSFTKLDIDNGNIHPYFAASPDLIQKPKRFKKKPSILPNIHKKDKTDESEKSHKTTSSRAVTKFKESQEVQSATTKSFWLPKQKQQLKTENFITKTEKETTTRKFYRKTENCKEIEILEIMEIVEPERIFNETPKVKSRIPIPIHQKLTKSKEVKVNKPTFLDFQVTKNDSKLDQLIANILIDTLNREDLDVNQTFMHAEKLTSKTLEQYKETSKETKLNNNPCLIEKAAEILTKQVLENNNLQQNYLAEAITKEMKNSNIPKGWITFYMLQKNGSPESTSDEGHNAVASKQSKSTQKSDDNCSKKTYKYKHFNSKHESDSESELSNTTYKQYNIHEEQTMRNGGWSVTVSGKANGNTGPDLDLKLKFPTIPKTKTKLRNHNVGIKNSESFPPLSNKNSKTSPAPGFSFEEVCTNRRSSEINKSKEYLRNYESKLNPRPTKTSKQRYLMNRAAYHRHYTDIVTPLDSNSQLNHIWGNTPDILEIIGNTLNRQTNKEK